MLQIKNLGTEKIVPEDTDFLPIQETTGTTRHISRGNLLSGLSNSGNSSPILNTIIYRDTNWVLNTRGNANSERQGIVWSSFNTAENNTGLLKIGYLTTRTKIHCLFAGGGNTNGHLKLIKIRRKADDYLLLDSNLSNIMGANDDNLRYCIIDTSSFSGTEIYLELVDNDNNSGWAWFGFSPIVFIE